MDYRDCDKYALALESIPETLKSSYSDMKKEPPSSDALEYSKIAINRLRAFYSSQAKIKGFLDKRLAQSGDTFFVETILFILKLYCDIEGLQLEVASERAIEPKRKTIRPDISIWSKGTLLGAVECKTQLGYQRNDWHVQFEHREGKLQDAFPNSKLFLVVMTSGNWSGFGDDARVEEKFFCLLDKEWPAFIKQEFDESIILNPIERLLDQIRILDPV